MESCEKIFRQPLNLLDWAQLCFYRQLCMAVAVWDIKQIKEIREASLGAQVHLHVELTHFD